MKKTDLKKSHDTCLLRKYQTWWRARQKFLRSGRRLELVWRTSAANPPAATLPVERGRGLELVWGTSAANPPAVTLPEERGQSLGLFWGQKAGSTLSQACLSTMQDLLLFLCACFALQLLNFVFALQNSQINPFNLFDSIISSCKLHGATVWVAFWSL